MEINTVFSILIAVGAGLGLYQVYRMAPARQAVARLDGAVMALLAGLVGARAGFVGLNWSYYAGKPVEAILISNGGLAWQGALAGALLALPVVSSLLKIRLSELADSAAHLLPPLGVVAWLGCWLAGCGCAPAVSGQPWWAAPSADESGLIAARFPLQPAAALLLALEFLLAHGLTGPNARPGLLASRFGLALGLNLLLFSFFSADLAPLYSGWRLSTWGGVALILLSLAGRLAVTLAGRLARLPSSSRSSIQSRT